MPLIGAKWCGYKRKVPNENMKKTSILAIALCSLIPATMLIGHQDDPKIRDRMPAYKGKGYKSAVPGSVLATGFDSENVQLLVN